MQLTSILLATVLATTTLAHPTNMTTDPTYTNDTTTTDSDSTAHLLSARAGSKRPYVGSYNNIDTTCQKPISGPNPARPKMTRGKCIKINREPGFSFLVFWGEQMNQQNRLSTFYDDNCVEYAKNYEKEGKRSLLCDDEVKDQARWGSAKIWVV